MLTRLHPERIAAASYVPTTGCNLTHLTNDELVAGTRRLVGASNQMFAMLLAHLAEVEARGIHRERACSSLYTYCIYELRFSEDAAFRRVSAARLVKRFPALYEAIASGELHLTGLLMLGPHLTPENHHEVLGRAKHRTKKELSTLVRTLDPLPDLPARIEPLAPAPARPASAKPSWAEFMESLSPVVRELGPGDAPRDWVNDQLPALAGVRAEASEPAPARPDASEPAPARPDASEPAPARPDASAPALARPDASAPALVRSEASAPALARSEASAPAPARPDASAPAPARPDASALTVPLRYGVQFSAEEEYVQLMERAKALLSHAHGKSTLEEIHLRAMRLLVADLEKRRFGKPAPPRRRREAAKGDSSGPSGSGANETKEMNRPGGENVAKRPGGENVAKRPGGEDVAKRPGGENVAKRPGGENVAKRPGGENVAKRPGGENVAKRPGEASEANEPNQARGANDSAKEAKRPLGASDSASDTGVLKERCEQKLERKRGRHVAAAVRREVFERDAERCTFVDAAGQRCREGNCLELHHLRPFARGGEHRSSNLTLRCRAHNAFAAEADFGRDFVARKRARRHEPFRSG